MMDEMNENVVEEVTKKPSLMKKLGGVGAVAAVIGGIALLIKKKKTKEIKDLEEDDIEIIDVNLDEADEN